MPEPLGLLGLLGLPEPPEPLGFPELPEPGSVPIGGSGMSGGGVFDESGRLLGMISGGDVPENSEKREAELTYSIPPVLIQMEYEKILEDT